MDARPRLPYGAGCLAGLLAGAVVGLADGIRSSVVVGSDAATAFVTAALVASVDALLGCLAGAVAEPVLRVARWGRRVRAPSWARALAYGLCGAATAAAAVAALAGTAFRNNRFLAAGLTALAALAATAAGLLLAPALARLVAGRRGRPAEAWSPRPAAALLGPAVVAAFATIVLVTVGKSPPGLAESIFTRALLPAALSSLVLPAALVFVVQVPVRVRWRWAAVAAAAAYGGAGIAGLAVTWNAHLRFAPWTDIAAGSLVVVAGIGLLLAMRGRWRVSGRRLAGVTSIALLLVLGGLFRAAESDPARKIAGARAGLVGPALQGGRRLLDLDGDHYARALGGGDCDDGDPGVHPGALDLPGDGSDADCDGQDATDPLPPPARMVYLPGEIPADLNLLLVTIDTLRADHLGCYGYPRPTSPEIDALAKGGALFENGWAHAPSTRYSMPAIASGRWPSAIAWDESIWWPRMAPNVRTAAQALHEAGYFTGGLFTFNYFALADRRGFERGMDVYRTDRAALHLTVNGPMESRGSSSREITDDAIAFVDEARDRRFFLWVHYYDPHLSYDPHPEVPTFGDSRVDRYDGEIRFTDLHFGRLVAHLRERGLWDRTAIVLTGDHGEGFGEHGVTEHGFDLYAPQTKVPFIVRVPGARARRVRAPAGHIDIAPTLLNLARGKPEPSFIGRSLVPDVTGPPAADRDTRAVFQEVTSERGKKRALVTADRHLIWNAVPGDTTECYDLASDPGERHDIWRGASGDRTCARLAGDLRRLVAGLALPAGAAEKLGRAVRAPGQPPPESQYRLEANLGEQIGLRGYGLSATEVRRGDGLDVSYDFVVRKRLAPGWRLFFHLEGPAGYRNLDHVPVDGIMPLERWTPGQHIRDDQRIDFPPGTPPGTYTLYLGAFRGADRLPVTPPALSDGKDRLRVFSVVVR